jgi:signal transduction histidine kinase
MKSLFRKLSVALFGLFLLVGGVTLAVTLVTSYLYQREVQQRIHRDLAAHIVSEELLIVDGEIAQEALKHVFHMMMVINPTIELYLLDPSGEILAYSAPPGKVKLASVALDPVTEYVDGKPRLPIVGDDPRHPGNQNIFSAAPIVRDGELEGYLYIVLASEQFVSVAEMLRGSYILRAGAIAVIGITIAALIGALLMSRRLTFRLTRLTGDMAVFRQESLDSGAGETTTDIRMLPPNQDEVDELRITFDHMAARIEDQIVKLEDQDRLRREMVANVSHDLRTPLTHLHGYLETLMLKEESLEPEQRQEYLDIALQHAKRLGRLVSDLFELAKLDALHEPLERERMPVGELVQDIAQKYRLPAEDRGVSLSAELAGELLWISADVGLIERALENVLDNALRYTPEGGRIDIRLEPFGEWLRIEVQDTGTGIAAGDLPLVFDRFHRAQRSDDEGESRGAGLGLAIAKRAVELHGGNIHCESTAGEGTTFRFELPVISALGGLFFLGGERPDSILVDQAIDRGIVAAVRTGRGCRRFHRGTLPVGVGLAAPRADDFDQFISRAHAASLHVFGTPDSCLIPIPNIGPETKSVSPRGGERPGIRRHRGLAHSGVWREDRGCR